VNTLEQEKLLLKGLAGEDKQAIEQIYRDNYNMIKNLVINNNGTIDDAADIFQEAMIVLFEKAKLEDFELHCQIKTFIYSVSRRIWLKKLQKQARYTTSSDSLEETIPVEDDV